MAATSLSCASAHQGLLVVQFRTAPEPSRVRMRTSMGGCIHVLYIPSVDAACVYECGGPTHDERRRASKSHEWCHSDAAGARVGACALPTEPVYTICRCMRVRVRRAHARRTAPCNQIARMTPQRRRYKPGGTVAGPVPHEYCRNFLRNSWYYTPADVVKLEAAAPN